MTKLILILALAVIPGQASALERLPTNVIPLSQSIDLTLDPDESGYHGAVIIDLNIPADVDKIVLHGEEMTIHSATLKQTWRKKKLSVKALDAGQLELTRGSMIKAGHYTLEMHFENNYNDAPYGLYRVKSGDSNYLFTQLEADDARQAFPCFDEPSFKIPFTFTLHVPAGHLGITNAPEVSSTTKDGWQHLHFAELPPTPSYALAIAAGPLETYPVPNMPIPTRIITVKGKAGMEKTAQSIIPPILPYLEDYFGQAYPYKKLDFIAVPNFWPGAMENPGAITFKEAIILQDPATATSDDRGRLAYIAAHELSHMWFGDLVTLAWWDDFWLNESFATWMGRKALIATHPEFRGEVTRLKQGLHIMDRDSLPTSRPIRIPVDASAVFETTNFMAYPKGQAVLTMFEEWMGEEKLREGVQHYIKAHQWGNATSDDLWAAFDQTSGLEVKKALLPYLDQPGVPFIEIDRNGRDFYVSQSRFFIGKKGVENTIPWSIPISFRYEDDSGTHTNMVFLDAPSATFTLPAEGDIQWFFPATEGRGYYRWNLPKADLSNLINTHLNDLNELERIALVNNLHALTKAGELDVEQFLGFLGSFVRDPSPEVASMAIAAQSTFGNDDLLPESLQPAYSRYLKETLTPALEAIGFVPNPEDSPATKTLRAQLYARLGHKAKDEKVREEATRIAIDFIGDPQSAPKHLIGPALAIFTADGDENLHSQFVSAFQETQDSTLRRLYLGGLIAMEDIDLQKANIELALNSGLNVDESGELLQGVGAHSQALLQDTIIENHDLILSQVDPAYAAWVPVMGVGCSEERLDKAVAFFSQENNHRVGMDRGFKNAALGVENCKLEQELYLPGLAKFLADFVEE